MKQEEKSFEIFGLRAKYQLIFNLLDVFFRESMKRFQGEEGRQGIGAGRAQEAHEVLLQGGKALCKRGSSGQRFALQHRAGEKGIAGFGEQPRQLDLPCDLSIIRLDAHGFQHHCQRTIGAGSIKVHILHSYHTVFYFACIQYRKDRL